MTYEQLIALQNTMQIVFLALVAIGALYLLIGFIRPAFVRANGRGRVALRALAVWLIGAAAYVGTIAYTHSHENGPHSAKRYINTYFDELCATGADIPACKKQAPPTTPAAE